MNAPADVRLRGWPLSSMTCEFRLVALSVY